MKKLRTNFFVKLKQKRKLLAILLLATLTPCFVIGFFFYQRFQPSDCQTKLTAAQKNLPRISTEELTRHDGKTEPTFYIGLNCLVYDVTPGAKDYYEEGKAYHYLVGKDSSKQLAIFGGDIIKSKYKAVGKLGN